MGKFRQIFTELSARDIFAMITLIHKQIIAMAGYYACSAFISTSFFAKCLHVGEDGPRLGNLCHIDNFLVY